MPRRIILVSGPIGCGKSTLATKLVNEYGFQCLKTRQVIAQRLRVPASRRPLQRGGNQLDQSTKGTWVRDALGRFTQKIGPNVDVIVDAVRTKAQIDAIRVGFGRRVTHLHLSAPQEVLETRYRSRRRNSRIAELSSYRAACEDPTEAQLETLRASADIEIDTARNTTDDVFVRVASRLGLYGHRDQRLVDVLVGGEFGSEGKGNIAAYLAPEYDVLVRVGGPNAGHKVYGEPPYTFHTLPSGTRRCEDGRLVLGPGAVIATPTLMKEIRDNSVSVERLTIDPQAMIIDESDRQAEAGLRDTIGSTAQGVGFATARKILRTAASPAVRLAKDAPELRPYIREAVRVFDDAFAKGRRILLEGTQGTGLSLHHGPYPHVTSRDTTVSGCLSEAGISPIRVRRVVMVCRTYPIRVESPKSGDSGPMQQEITWKEVSRRSGIPVNELEEKEKTSTTHKRRRVGEFEWPLLRKAASLNGPTDVALTFVDYLSVKNKRARRFEQLTKETIWFVEEVERVARAPVSLIATRFDFRSIIDRRRW